MKTKFLIYLFTLFIIADLYAQDTELETMKVGYSGVPSYMSFNTDIAQFKKSDTEAIWKEYLEITPFDKMEKIKSRTDKYGMEHLKFQQYYKGVKVEGGTYVLHLKKGIITSANGSFLKIEDLDVTPFLKPKQAVYAAIDKEKKYTWESEEIETAIKINTCDTAASFYPKVELIIWHPYKENIAYLAYKVNVCSLEPASFENVYIDALTGEILHREELSRNSYATGGGTTRYSGVVDPIYFFKDSEDHYIMKDTHEGSLTLHTWNLQHYGAEYASVYRIDFENDNVNWSEQDWDDWSNDKNNAAVDAHWALQKIYDYFDDYHNWPGFDGENTPINCYVHWGTDYPQAMWYSASIYLGDGDDINLDAVASFDIIAHEFAHGINESTCNVHGSLESNTISEGLSDI